MQTETEITLLDRLRNGTDSLAWREFSDRYRRFILAVAKKRGCSDHTVEEIVQDVMLEVFRERDDFVYDRSRGRFRDWLAKVTCNKIAEHYRQPAQRIRGRGGDGGDDFPGQQSHDGQPDELWETTYEQAMLAALLDVVAGKSVHRRIKRSSWLRSVAFRASKLPRLLASAGTQFFSHESECSTVYDNSEPFIGKTASFTSA